MRKRTFTNNQPLKLPFSTESWRTKLLDCSRLSPQPQSSPIPTRSDATEESYLDFLKRTYPPTWTIDAEHIREIALHLEAVERGEIDRLAIHMPPRHAKSETVTYRFPVRWLLRNPTDNVLVTGYNERFARKFGRRSRNMAMELGIVGSDKTAADEWETTAGGLYMARGVGSPPTGTGFRLINIDDPIRRREDADSEVYREKVWDWYTDDLYTRLEPGGAIVLVMTLWHEDDLGARAVASEAHRWTVLKLKAIDDSGKALWPERYPVAALERIREVMRRNEGERSWEALYQQNPTPREGAFFKPGMLEIVDAIPGNLPSCRAWDMAATENDGDYTAGVKLAGPDATGLWYVVDVRRGRWGTDTRNQEIKAAALSDGTSVKIRGPQDPGAAGKEAAKAFVRMLAGYTVKTAMVSGAKEVRADPFSAQVNAGNVRLLRGDWNAAFIEELRTFPGGKHDDQVDAVSDAFAELAVPRRKWGEWS